MAVCESGDVAIDVIEVTEKPTLEAPAFAMVDTPFDVTGKTPEPNQGVWIEVEKLGLDEKIAQGISDPEGKFTIELIFTEIDIVKIHSEIEKPWAINPKSATQSVIVLDWWIVGVIVALGLFLLYRMGVFNKLVKKAPKRKRGRPKKKGGKK